MSDEWGTGTLADLVDANPDKGSATAAIPRFRYVDISCLSRDGVAPVQSIAVVTRSDAPSRAQRLLRTGDVLVGTVRPERGARGIVPAGLDGHVASTGICVLRPKCAADAGFVHAVVRDPAFTDWCVAHETGTSYPAVSPKDVLRYPLPIPSRVERGFISELLVALDRAIDGCLETIAITDSAVEVAGTAALERSTTTRTAKLSSIASFANGYSYGSSELVEESSVAMVNLKNFGRAGGFRFDGLKPISASAKPEQVLRAGDLMVAKTDLTQDAEVIGRCLRMPGISNFTSYIASLDIAIVRPTSTTSAPVLHALLSQPDFRDHCLGYTNGTTVLHLGKSALPDYDVALPDARESAWLEEQVRAITAVQDASWAKLVSLRELRNFLLPRLLSGELRVSEAAKLAEVGA
jgi:type I restriction enzyme S subunit